MKHSILTILTLFALIFNACQSTEQRVDFDHGISIAVPKNYIIEESSSSATLITLIAKDQDQQIICSIMPISRMDTIDSDQLSSILEVNTVRYIEPFDGKEISIHQIFIDSTDARQFSFNCIRDNSSYQVFGKSLIYNDNLIFLTFMTIKPISRNVNKKMLRFFGSVQLK